MEKEFSNSKSAKTTQSCAVAKTRNLSKLLLAVLLSIVFFGGAMFLLFANHTAPVSTALANTETAPVLPYAPNFLQYSTYTRNGVTYQNALVGAGKMEINGELYDFSQDIYEAVLDTDENLGATTEGRIVKILYYRTPSNIKAKLIFPSQMLITTEADPETEQLYQVVIDTYDWPFGQDLIEIDFACVNGTNVILKSAPGLFFGCTKLERVDLTYLNTSNATDMSQMFCYCSNLTSITWGEHFDTTNVTNMSNMFFNCNNLANLDVSSFDTGNVTNMVNMFCNCFALTNLNLSSFDTKSVTDMGSMFDGCSNLSTITFGQTFDTSSVTAMTYMFKGCSSLTNLDLRSFDTSNVTDMTMMFSGCSSLKSLNISSFTFDSISSPTACIGTLGLNKVYLKNIIDSFGKDGETYANLVYPENGEPNAQVLAQLLVNLGFTSSSDTALTFANSLLATKIDKIIAPTNALNANAVIGLPGTYYNSADAESAGQYFLTNGTNLVLTTTPPVPSTGVATSLLFALSGAVVVALFAVAVAHVGKKKRVIKK